MTALVNVAHDRAQPVLGVLERPGIAAGVLLHLQRRGGDTSRVGGLAGPESYPGLVEGPDRLGGGGHVGAFGHRDTPVGDELFGVAAGEFVLGGTRQRNLTRDVPDDSTLL